MPGRNFLSISGRRELAALARDLRAHEDGRALDDELRKEFAKIGAPAVQAVRASIRSIPSKGQSAGRGRRSLRSEMAAAVEQKTRTTRRPGLIIWVNPRRMGPGRNNLPGYMDGQRPFHRWRHPTYGSWSGRRAQTQRPHPYFDRALRSVPGNAERAANNALGYIADRLERG